jgi:hypothetical protein
LGPGWIETIVLAERWRCRPSEADNEPAVWVLRQRAFDQVKATYRRLAEVNLDDDED